MFSVGRYGSRSLLAGVIAAAVFSLLFAVSASGSTVTVSAAISLQEALQEMRQPFKAASGDTVRFNFGASGHLAEQIQAGAPVDVFISAARKQIDDLAAAKRIDAASRRVVAWNDLVLIVAADSKELKDGFGGLADPKIKRISIGRPQVVPAGDYAMQVFTTLKIVDSLRPRLVYGQNVRQVLDYVERGEVDAGIVYRTDALASSGKSRVVATADSDWHKPIEYPAVIVSATADRAAAERFIRFLTTAEARAILRSHGFATARNSAATAPASRPAAAAASQP